MTARTQVVAPWSYADNGPLTVFTDSAGKNIPAGSVVVRFMRWEGGVTTLSFADDAGGTYTSYVFGGAPSLGISYCWNHPGGTSVKGTMTLGASRTYLKMAGAAYDGSDASDPFDVAPAGVTGQNASIAYTASAAGRAWLVQSEEDLINPAPVSPATELAVGWVDGGVMTRTHAAGSNTIATTSNGSSLARAMALVLKDPGAGGTVVDLAANAAAQASATASLPSVHSLAADAVVVAAATAALTGGAPAGTIDVEVTGLNFEGAGTATLEQAFPYGIGNMSYVYWEKQAAGHNTEAYFGGHQINRADRTFTGADGIMTVQHNCAGTYNATTGQRDAGVGSTVFDEIATIGTASDGKDRIASHSSYVYSGETQQSFPRVDGVWMPRALTVEMDGTLAIVTFYADARDMTSMLKVIRQPWETSGGGVTGVDLAMFIGCVPWETEYYQAKTFGRKTYLRTLTKSEILTKLFTFSDDTTDPDIHFSNQFPAITGGTTMADMSGQGNDFTLVDADAPAAFTETASFTIPSIPVVDLGADATAQAGASATLLKGVSLSGAGLAVAGASASVSHVVPLAASAVAVAVAGAQMALAVQLSGAAIATAAASAGLDLAVLLAADGAAQAGASADLSTNASVDLAAAAQASASASAVLSLTVSLSAAAVGQALASAALAKVVELGADGAAQAGGTAGLQVGGGIDLAAAATAQASAGASLWLDVPLGADALAQALAGGSLSLVVLLGADALASAAGSGALAADVQLSAAGQVIATASAGLQVTGPISSYLKGFRAESRPRAWTAGASARSWVAASINRI